MTETIKSLEELGYTGMVGLLRAKFHGIITDTEYRSIKDYAHTTLGIPTDWHKVLVFGR